MEVIGPEQALEGLRGPVDLDDRGEIAVVRAFVCQLAHHRHEQREIDSLRPIRPPAKIMPASLRCAVREGHAHPVLQPTPNTSLDEPTPA